MAPPEVTPSSPPGNRGRELAATFAERAAKLLDVLDHDQRAAVLLPFDDDDGGEDGDGDGNDGRRTWAYWPRRRSGLALHQLDRGATKAVMRLVSTALPAPAYARAVTIMGLDEVLDRSEGFAGDRRHRDDYWVAIHGRPGEEVWGWRFEGHHVSLHATVTPASVDLTPLFLGANPAVVHEQGRPVVAPLSVEEALGFELLHALTVEQRSDAVVADTAPDDILTRNAPRIDAPTADLGVPLAALAGPAATTAQALLDVYLSRFPPGCRRPDPDGARFAWSGASRPGVGHHYRIAGPRLLVELDNTQDGANHVHTVVRDPEADFGGDPLADHRRHAHP